MGRRRRKKSAASSSTGYPPSCRYDDEYAEPPDANYWDANGGEGRALLKTVAIVAPLSGRVLTLFHHYAENNIPDEENPAALELMLAVEEEHPPPDHEHEWILIDPKTGEEIPTTLDNRTPFDTVHAILRIRDWEANMKKYEEWRAAGYRQ